MKWKLRIQRFWDSHLYGILGTIAFHLLLVFLFMLAKLSYTHRNIDQLFLFDFSEEKTEITEDLPEEPEERKPALDEDERFWHNIAVNQAKTSKEEFDLNEFVDQLKQELLEEGSLNRENWEEGELRNNLEMISQQEGLDMTEEDEEEEHNLSEMADNYTGPTNISYYLPDRSGTYICLPIYKCMEGGKVIIRIEVGQDGKVYKARPDEETSLSGSPCLQEAAMEAALRSRFNISTAAPARQEGSITYQFQSQNNP